MRRDGAAFRDMSCLPLLSWYLLGTHWLQPTCFAAKIEGKPWYLLNFPQGFAGTSAFQDVAGTIIGTTLVVLAFSADFPVC
jgi:hypothetical protein